MPPYLPKILPLVQRYAGVGVLLLSLFGCSPSAPSIMERPVDLWVMRSVLDQKPRVVTLALYEDRYAAYDTENCRPFKIWRGGVHWVGAAFNNVKTIQPTSWGHPYFVQDDSLTTWEVATADGKQPVEPQFRGYRLENNRLTFQYEFSLPGNHTATVYEWPEWVGEHGFQQEFILEEMPENVQLLYRGQTLKTGRPTKLVEHFTAAEPPASPALHLVAHGSRYWLDRSGCNTCHEENEKTVGPAYREIAGKYEANAQTVSTLVRKVKEGGSGNWGEVPMNPHPDLADADIAQMIKYILSLKPKESNGSDTRQKTSADGEAQENSPGFGAPLVGLHPGLKVQTIRPAGFRPRVGGLDFLPDGTLLVTTWDSIGAVYALSGVVSGDTSQITVRRMAAGLAEPLGIKVVGEEVYVLQKQELTQLIDWDKDGVADEYRTVCNSFGATPDFHEYSYGLVFHEGYFYATLGLAMRMMSHEVQHPDRGTVIRIGQDGSFSKIAVGLRQPNGIGLTPDNKLVITENQGRWVPANKVIVVEEGAFYGCRKESGGAFADKEETPPTVWLPQDEIGNSPSQPVSVSTGIYRGQLLHGEVTHGGIKAGLPGRS